MTFEVSVSSIHERGTLKKFCTENELQLERLDANTINVYGVPDDFVDDFTDFCDANKLVYRMI